MATTGIFNFGGKNLKTLYDTYNSKAKVFEFLDAVIASATDPLKTELTTIKNQIALLSAPDGNEYLDSDGKTRPRQHIRRVVTPEWQAKVRKASKFAVEANKPGHWWAKQAGARPYWSPFDLLGLFFAKMGPAPNFATANEVNFYLPLTAVYARFCMWIGFNKTPAVKGVRDRKGPGIGDPSYYFQCTWDPQTGDFFLGAVLAGYEWDLHKQDFTGSWKDDLKQKRYSLLSGFHTFPGTYTTWQESPTRDYRPGSQVFGNCAETYPFLEMLGPHVNRLDKRRQMEGLALQRDFAQIAEYNAAEVKSYVGPPCPNCQQLLRWAGSLKPNDYHFDPRKTRPVAVKRARYTPVTLSSDALEISLTSDPATSILPADPPTVPVADPPTVPPAIPTTAS